MSSFLGAGMSTASSLLGTLNQIGGIGAQEMANNAETGSEVAQQGLNTAVGIKGSIQGHNATRNSALKLSAKTTADGAFQSLQHAKAGSEKASQL
jgi:hypothetical protein